VVVFVDGVDGTGKSTLIYQLSAELAAQSIHSKSAAPLWSFLDPITAPGEFAAWVQHAGGLEVAHHLLAAMTRRVNTMADIARAYGDFRTVLFADRGPKTVTCSARTHADSGILPVEPRPIHSALLLAAYEEDLRRSVAALQQVTKTVVVELIAEQPDLVLDRLAALESITPSYRRYLLAFCRRMAASPAWPGVPRRLLPAAGDLSANTASAAVWIASHLDLRP
jgi:hypothetical protein